MADNQIRLANSWIILTRTTLVARLIAESFSDRFLMTVATAVNMPAGAVPESNALAIAVCNATIAGASPLVIDIGCSFLKLTVDHTTISSRVQSQNCDASV